MVTDHDIPEIRVRALKSLHRKLELGLVYGQRLSKRIDLLQRLTSWLRSNKWTEDELLLILSFLSQMCQVSFAHYLLDYASIKLMAPVTVVCG
jgi:hypothetical protein